MVAISGLDAYGRSTFPFGLFALQGAPAPEAQAQIPPELQALFDLFQMGGTLDNAQRPASQPSAAPNMQMLELLQLLIDYLANFAQEQQQQQRQMSSLPSHGFSQKRPVSAKSWGAGGGTRALAAHNGKAVSGNGHVPKSKHTGKGTAHDFVKAALAQKGDRYIFGTETKLNDPNPKAFDCSELVQWAAAQAGVKIADGSWNQAAACKKISVKEAMRTPGALLFHPGHVAISLGDGRTIEAANSRVGVVIANAAGRFTSGGLIPGMTYG